MCSKETYFDQKSTFAERKYHRKAVKRIFKQKLE